MPMPEATIRKPTKLDFTDERFAIGDRAAAVTKQNQFSDEMEEFSRQVNDEMIPDILEVTNDAITARNEAEQYAMGVNLPPITPADYGKALRAGTEAEGGMYTFDEYGEVEELRAELMIGIWDDEFY